ncbi:MAG: SpoIID/LytB domain-containing protein [Deltaproteobacteria bacterium]|nr:SpoIID/LytB domain-containing protein [Deltaproteobacteria bacterium]
MVPPALILPAMMALGLASQVPAEGRHDDADLLYSTQLRFAADGQPVVTVGLMEGQESVTLRAAAGLTVALSGPGDATVTLPPGHALTLSAHDATPGQTRYRVALESLPPSEFAEMAKARHRWTDRGLSVDTMELGGVVGYPARMLDNRRSFLVESAPHATPEAAEARAAELASAWNLATVPGVFAEPVKRATGTVLAVDRATGLTVSQHNLLAVAAADGGPVEVARVEYARGYAQHGFQDRSFHGTIIVAIDPSGRLAVVNRVPAEEMLRGLVPAETFPSAPAAALEAQAITARGELLAKLGVRHLADPYLVCSEQHCQVYAGRSREEARTDAAVARTHGRMLFDGDGQLVDSVYSASCGGHTEDCDAVWGGAARASLRGVPDAPDRADIGWARNEAPTEAQLRRFLEHPPDSWCALTTKGRGSFRWERALPDDELDRMVNARHPIGHVTAIEVQGRGVSGRVTAVRFVGTDGEVVVERELPVRRLLGNLKSGMFVVDREDGRWRFTGGGYGHGVGMCQYGAIGMAERGSSAAAILKHYYSGAKVERVY